MTQTEQLGYQNSTLKAVGGENGLAQLVEQFYTIMDTANYAREIRAMHPQDLTLAKQKLTSFLTGWMGGPRRYAEKFGPISIPGSHAHFDIKERHRDAWLSCMNDALIEKSIPDNVREYLMAQLSLPAQRIVEASAAYSKSRSFE